MTHLQNPSLYERLQLHPTASQQEIQAAYRRLRQTSPRDQFDLDQAHAVLSDPASRAAYDAMCRESIDPPPSRPFLFLYGLLSGTVGYMSRFRLNYVPFNWVISFVLFVVGGFIAVDSLIPSLTEPTPTATTIAEIIAQTDGPRHVTVAGKVSPEPLYIKKMKYTEQKFYGMTDGRGLLLVSHTKPVPGIVRLTGRLVKMDSELRRLLQPGAAQRGLQAEEIFYLDAALRTTETAAAFGTLALLCGIGALMIIPSLRGNIAFAPVGQITASAPPSLLPSPVRATGRYRSALGDSVYVVGASAVLLATDNPETPYRVYTRFRERGVPEGISHEIRLHRGANVTFGYDYAFGRPKPGLLINGPTGKVLLTLDDATTAAGLAALLQRDLQAGVMG